MQTRSASKRKLAETTIDLVSRGDRTPAQFRAGQQHTFCTGLNTKHASTTTNSAKKRCVWRQVKVATLNTRATLTRGRLFELEEGCKSYKINIVGVQEHRRQTIDSKKRNKATYSSIRRQTSVAKKEWVYS